MSVEEFSHIKNNILSGGDKSRRGAIDSRIERLVCFINNNDDYVTTSSCSGRLIVFCEDETKGMKKKGCKWLYTSHDLVHDDTLISKLDPAEGNAVLKFEPFILHVRCLNLDSAKSMLTCALQSGFKNSGLVVGKQGKIILAVRSCLGLEVPLANDGLLLVSEDYIKFLIGIVNQKFTENFKRTENFFSLLKKRFGAELSSEESQEVG